MGLGQRRFLFPLHMIWRYSIYLVWGDSMRKLLFITWSISYGYGTEKFLADVLNRMDKTKYEISVLPLFKNAESTIFNSDIKILNSLIDYTEENFDEKRALNHYYSLLADPLRFNKLIQEKYDEFVMVKAKRLHYPHLI